MARRRTSSKRSTKRNCGRNPYREDTYYADREIRKAKKARSRKSKRATKTGMKAVLGRMNPRGGTKHRRRATSKDREHKDMLHRAAAITRPFERKKRRGIWSRKPSILVRPKTKPYLSGRAQLASHGIDSNGEYRITKREARRLRRSNPRPNENDIPTVIIVRKGKGRNPPITPAQARAIKAVLRRHGY